MMSNTRFVFYSVFILVIEILSNYRYSGSILNSLTTYEIVNPVHLHHQRSRRDLSTREDVGHLPSTSFLVKSREKEFHIHLFLNRGLLHANYKESYQNEDGSEYTIKNDENCFYHGTLAEEGNTFVAFSTCNGLSGIIHDSDGEQYAIEPLHEEDAGHPPTENEHILYNTRDLKGDHMECGVNETNHHDFHDFHGSISHHLTRRATSATEKKYVSLVFVVDKRLYDRHGKNSTKTSLRAKEVANYVDGVYKTLGVRVALVMVETWNIFDLIHVSDSAGEALSSFQKYVSTVLNNKGYKQDNAQLLSGIDFAGVVVGMAGIGTICGASSAGVNQDRSSASVVANTVAHEMGHNIGMHHNEDKCNCPNTPCVMNAVANYKPVKGFSSCSKDMLGRRIKDGVASCLFDTPSKLFGDPVCGNDFLEEGEECDCGTEEECKASGGDKCCDHKTCTLHSSAECAVGPCCKDCKFKSRGTLCRPEMTECDLSEYCTGKSHLCPGNFYRQDGTPCKGDKAYCFEGGCRTHDEQCEVLWGKGAKMAADICYNRLNQRANEYGHCGKNKRGEYLPCAPENNRCGKLHCKDTPGRFPVIGSASRVSDVRYSVGSKSYQCRVAVISLGKDLEDPTIVGQGTKCAEGKVCYNYTCTNITSLEFVKQCRYECKNGGICNNNGNCHCKAGYACPDCTHSGPGGSIDSGLPCYVPPSEGGLSSLAKGMLVLFLLVLPLLAITGFLAYKYRDKLRARFGKRRNATTSAKPKRPSGRKAKEPPLMTSESPMPSGNAGRKERNTPVEPRYQAEPGISKPSRPPPKPTPSPRANPPPRGPPPAPGAATPSRAPPKPPVGKRPMPYPQPSPFSTPTKTPPSLPTKPAAVLPPVRPPAKGRLPDWPPKPNPEA